MAHVAGPLSHAEYLREERARRKELRDYERQLRRERIDDMQRTISNARSAIGIATSIAHTLYNEYQRRKAMEMKRHQNIMNTPYLR